MRPGSQRASLPDVLAHRPTAPPGAPEGQCARAGRKPTVEAMTSDEKPSPHHQDRKSTRPNSSHVANSYAVFYLKKKNISFTTVPRYYIACIELNDHEKTHDGH